ncbi:MAG TPA: hypothetical protein VGE02_05195, partial [Gemmatimonadales bacterium]
ARAGAELGIAEASRTAALLGGVATLVTAPVDDAGADPAAAARRLVEHEGVHALVGGGDDAAAAALAGVAGELGVPLLNVGATSDGLRRARCASALTFHVEASRRMYDDAISLAPDGAAGPTPVIWHESLERYGAAQLNDRFRARFGRGMDGPAWAGWFAVKALWESAARGSGAADGAGDGAGLARALATSRFDGHKGRRLSFRAWDGQLRQPLYLVARAGAATSPVEVPAAPRGERVDSDELLDRLGAPAPAGACAGAEG